MIIRPELLPDEIDRSYLGRVLNFNQIQNHKELLKQVKIWQHDCENPSDKCSVLEALSIISGITLRELVCKHTTLPLRRSITGTFPKLAHGSLSNKNILIRSGMNTARQGAYMCYKCVQNDKNKYGISYWHREHQIPGIFWCSEHHTSLDYIEDNNAFLHSPDFYTSAAISIEKTQIAAFKKNKTIQKFIDMSSELLRRDKPLYHKAVAQILRQRATEKKLRNLGGTSESPLLSDIVVNKFNQRWLEITYPKIKDKKHGKFMHPLDGLFYGKDASKAPIVYILAASVLFKTSEEAIKALTSSRLHKENDYNKDPKYRTPLGDSKLKELYMQNDGDYSAVVSDMHRKKVSVRSRLISLGLPNLAGKSGATLDFIEAFLLDNKSLEESIEISGISNQAMENVLRTLGNSFTPVIKEIKRHRQYL